MQEPYFKDLPVELAKEMFGEPRETEAEKLRKHLEKMNQEGKLFGLTEDESAVLLAYREWKRSPACASGVFHWRKQ